LVSPRSESLIIDFITCPEEVQGSTQSLCSDGRRSPGKPKADAHTRNYCGPPNPARILLRVGRGAACVPAPLGFFSPQCLGRYMFMLWTLAGGVVGGWCWWGQAAVQKPLQQLPALPPTTPIVAVPWQLSTPRSTPLFQVAAEPLQAPLPGPDRSYSEGTACKPVKRRSGPKPRSSRIQYTVRCSI